MSDSGIKARKRGRGGRPSKGPRVASTIRFPQNVADAIEAIRLDTGGTTNDVVTALVQRAIEAGLAPRATAGQMPLSA